MDCEDNDPCTVDFCRNGTCVHPMRDTDRDGVCDLRDNCRFVYNPGQADFDHDGRGDRCDPDIDNDGVPNDVDVCDFTPLGATVQPNGTLLADTDGDCDVDLQDAAFWQREITGPSK